MIQLKKLQRANHVLSSLDRNLAQLCFCFCTKESDKNLFSSIRISKSNTLVQRVSLKFLQESPFAAPRQLAVSLLLFLKQLMISLEQPFLLKKLTREEKIVKRLGDFSSYATLINVNTSPNLSAKVLFYADLI